MPYDDRPGSGEASVDPGSVITMGQTPGTRRRGLDSVGVRILLGAGFVMAVAASMFVVFADEARWLRLAVLLGLWAALLAAFAVAKSRRDARAAELRQEEMTRIYELELQREVSARREFEAQLAETTRLELESKHNDELAALREQVERLTSVLSGFFDGDLMVERLTLSAEATRVRAVGDAGQLTALGPMARQLVEGRAIGPERSEPVWGPLPPPLRGPFPAGPGHGPDPRADAVTVQIPRVVEPGPEAPVIDARPPAPRVVGVPRARDADRGPDPTADAADTVDGGPVAEGAVAGPEDLAAVRTGAANQAGPGADAAADARSAAEVSLDATTEPDLDYVEIERGATEPESGWAAEPTETPDTELVPDAEPEPEPDAELVPDAEPNPAPAPEDEPGTEVQAQPTLQDEPESAQLVRFTPATDVPDAPTRGDAPATAWTLRHRLDTPAAPVRPTTPTGRRAARMAAAASAAQGTSSDAVAEVTTGTHETSGHASGVSVAELLAAYGSSVPPRRRRHPDDD
jgi:hypothetical protein